MIKIILTKSAANPHPAPPASCTQHLNKAHLLSLSPQISFHSFSPSDQKFATGSDDGTVRIWDFYRCYEEKVLRGKTHVSHSC